MGTDAFIFVALAVAWAVYLIPKAIGFHHQAMKNRAVDGFSHTLRVLARREPISRRNATLVVPSREGRDLVSDSSGALAANPDPGPSPAEIRARRQAARVAARRRRRVLSLILIAIAAVAAVAAFRVIEWWYVAIPAGLLVAWLVACRLMVRGEHRSWDRLVHPERFPVPVAEEPEHGSVGEANETTVVIEAAAIADAMRDPAMWDPVPVTLPTYVTKPAAERTVRTIDLDDSGVWTSGRTEADSVIAREADAAARAEREAARTSTLDPERRETGS